MDKEKRMAGDFEIQQALHIGDKEIVYGVNLNGSSGIEYLVADYHWNELFAEYSNAGASNDYLEIITEYVNRIQQQIEKVKAERDAVTVPTDIITAEQCYPNDYKESIEGKVIAIKASALRPEHRRADVQIVYVTGGFGSKENARGNAVYVDYLYSGEHTRFERYDVQGVLKPEYYPDWVKDKLKLYENKQEHQQEKNPKYKEMER